MCAYGAHSSVKVDRNPDSEHAHPPTTATKFALPPDWMQRIGGVDLLLLLLKGLVTPVESQLPPLRDAHLRDE
jgi:hypothetical protein